MSIKVISPDLHGVSNGVGRVVQWHYPLPKRPDAHNHQELLITLAGWMRFPRVIEK